MATFDFDQEAHSTSPRLEADRDACIRWRRAPPAPIVGEPWSRCPKRARAEYGAHLSLPCETPLRGTRQLAGPAHDAPGQESLRGSSFVRSPTGKSHAGSLCAAD